MKGPRSEGYNQALEHMRFIYNRLYIQGKLSEGCSRCPVMRELGKILDLSKEIEVEKIERELGYFIG